jgi:predicted AAA+ superfamily ATPase
MNDDVDFTGLVEQSWKKLDLTAMDFKRSLGNRIHWQSRLIGIRGARGTGKTTLLLQKAKEMAALTEAEPHGGGKIRVLYASLDNMWFELHNPLELAAAFAKQGGTHLFFDEVHKVDKWARYIKNIYDDYPELSVVFTGSSLLEILNARADLSRRAVAYTMQGLSFREYLNLKTGKRFGLYSLEEILHNYSEITREILAQVKPFEHWLPYLQTGYYPYFTEGLETYSDRLGETVNIILEWELPLLRQVQLKAVSKLKKLMAVIAESVPFIPNTVKLAELADITRPTLLSYLQYLDDAHLTRNLYGKSRGISALQKPDKLFLENTNLMYLFKRDFWDMGNVRETFLANQLAYEHTLAVPSSGDFLVDDTYLIEVGGKNKTKKQLKAAQDTGEFSHFGEAYIAADGIEYGFNNKIPLWLFGFLY